MQTMHKVLPLYRPEQDDALHAVLQSNAQLGITKLKLLCEISAPDIPSFLEDNDLAGMTVAQIKAAIAERDSQAEQISLLTEQVQTLEGRPVEVAVAEPDEETLQRLRAEAESAWKEERTGRKGHGAGL